MCAYAQAGHVCEARTIFDSMEGDDKNVVSWTAMISAYARGDCPSSWGEAKRLFDRMPSGRNIVSWGAVLAAHCHGGDVDTARHIHGKMPEWDAVSWAILLTAQSDAGLLEEATAGFHAMPSIRDVVLWNALLQAQAKNGQLLEDDKRIFHKMPQWDPVSWNTIIGAVAAKGSIEEAQWLHECLSHKTVVSWNAMIAALGASGIIEEAEAMFQRMPERSLGSWSALVASLAGNGYCELFDRFPEKSVRSWNSIIEAYAQSGQMVEAKTLFDSMPERNNLSWNAALAAYAANGQLEEAVSTFGRMSHCNTCSWNCMVAAFAHKGRLEDAKILFNNTPQHNLASWNNIIGAYAAKGHGHEALDLFQEMVLAGFTPDCITFMHVLGACSHVGMLRRSCELFAWMSSEHYRSPTRQHYYRMIDVVARAGEVAEAERLVHGLPFSPDPVAWSTVLAACRTHGDVECGARAAQQLDESCSNHYVLLSNMFVAVGRREDAACLRRSMQDKGLRKPPGVSIVEPHF
ncbi:hypothetical protein SELMODRAFT_75322 [Selaginella moellendorffii]|uniref:Pentacotripeptide-repeat region of PRORP domain-containing protein n=1 Tax=Selaginella moellendorffii TaxID=88036 RepID=D8QPA4_SELML|nr:hypothetical protein SELMODRAFT_75322 [Selaginella moellendorffii]